MSSHSFDYPIRCTDPSHGGEVPIVGWVSGTSQSAYIQRHLPGTDQNGNATQSGSIGRQLVGSDLAEFDAISALKATEDAGMHESVAALRQHRQAHEAKTRNSYTIPCSCGVNAAIRQERLDHLAAHLLDCDLPTDTQGAEYVPLIVLNG